MTPYNVCDEIIKVAAELAGICFSPGDSPRIFVKVGKECYATSPGTDFSAVTADDIVRVTGEASSEKAALVSSSELMAMVVARTPHALTCFEECFEIPAVLDDMAQIIGSVVRFVPATRAELSKALKKAPAVITEQGDVLACGRTPSEAATCLLVLEKNAEIFFRAHKLGELTTINPVIARLEHIIYKKKYSKKEVAFKASACYEDSSEKSTPTKKSETGKSTDNLEDIKRAELIEYGKRLLKENLVQGTWGNLSVRLDESTMLCTPSGLGYDHLKPCEIVKVNINDLTYEGNLKPTSEKMLHAVIYRSRSDVGSVIHTHSKYCAVFAACDKSLIMPEGVELKCAPYAISGTKRFTENSLEALGENDGALMSHHGMFAVGSGIESAFNYCRLMESSALEAIEKVEKNAF